VFILYVENNIFKESKFRCCLTEKGLVVSLAIANSNYGAELEETGL
jgi:hypothetical protein